MIRLLALKSGILHQEPHNHQEVKMSSVGYHEPIEELSDETRDMHRAIVSLMEEPEAVDCYNQRAESIFA